MSGCGRGYLGRRNETCPLCHPQRLKSHRESRCGGLPEIDIEEMLLRAMLWVAEPAENAIDTGQGGISHEERRMEGLLVINCPRKSPLFQPR